MFMLRFKSLRNTVNSEQCKSCITLKILNYGSYDIFHVMGNS